MSAVGVAPDRFSGGAPVVPTVQRLAVAWQHPRERGIHPVGLLSYDGARYRFRYVANALDVQDFRPLMGFPDLLQAYASETLFPIFAQRVMDPRRSDYVRYVQRLGLNPQSSPWEQLARSGGRRQGDTIQVFPEPLIRGGVVTCDFLVHGIRHVVDRHNVAVEETLAALCVGAELVLRDEPTNDKNPRAILATTHGGEIVGWVPDLLVDDLHALRGAGDVEVTVARVNGPDAPCHLRLLAHLRATAPRGYRPFSGPQWDPLA